MELICKEENSKTLCLNMIVKNESKIIARLLDSVYSIIDCYCICDTGSTDNTVEIIENYFKNKNIPGKIVHEPFKNFCYNRNIALQSCVGMSDYVILLDADMVLDIRAFNKSILNSSDYFNIIQGNDSFYYQNMRIVKNNGLCKYVGVTHEYIDIPANTSISTIDKSILFIKDIGDGGSKSNKFERDIQLLTDGIKDEPNNGRYYFYLANSYYDLNKFDEAIVAYKKRIEIGGWIEEIWYSYYRIGTALIKQQKLPEALWNFMEGFNLYPERLEGLYEIIKFYRLNGKNKAAFAIYNICEPYLDDKKNRDHYLFLHNDVYKHLLYYEFTIIAAYNEIKNVNDEIVKIMNNCNDANEINNLLTNMKFYKDILKLNSKLTFDNIIKTIINGEEIILNSSSSCLMKNVGEGYKLNIRYVNYKIYNDGSYSNCEKHIITVNKYVELTQNFEVLKQEWFDIEFDGRLYIGIEDVRIFFNKYKNVVEFIGTGYHKNNKIGIVSGVYNTESKKLISNELITDFSNSNCEKNWTFVDYKNESHIIYSWHPLKICKLTNNVISVSETRNMPKIFSTVRGSSCGFCYTKQTHHNDLKNELETEIWFIGHIVSYEWPRHYYHIISVFDSNMNLIRYSAPFKFEGEPIEYCLSIVVEDDRVLINYSAWDSSTRIGIYDKKYIDSIVKYYL